MSIIDKEWLDRVSMGAKESPRLRMNHNFHTSPDAKAQRLINALAPGTEVPVHRHRHTGETYFLIRGALKVMFHADSGEVTEEFYLNPAEGNYGVHIPAGTWHSLDVLEEDSVIFEVKDGPYMPIAEEDILKVEAISEP